MPERIFIEMPLILWLSVKSSVSRRTAPLLIASWNEAHRRKQRGASSIAGTALTWISFRA